jgi:two-component system, OmpR family, sensor histidine kinase BaeS
MRRNCEELPWCILLYNKCRYCAWIDCTNNETAKIFLSKLIAMRIPLWVRLFISFGVLCVVSLTALTVLQRGRFQEEFFAFVDQKANLRVERVAQVLGKRYEQVGNWSFIARKNWILEAIIDGNEDEVVAEKPDATKLIGPLRNNTGGESAAPPKDVNNAPAGRPPEGPRGFRPPQHRIDGLNIHTRIALLNNDGLRIIGNPLVPANSPAWPVMAGGVQVGKVLLAVQPAVGIEIDTAFLHAQAQNARNAAFGVLLAALVVAWFLARWLLSPVAALGRHMQQLAAGDYDQRMVTTRKDELGELALNYNRLAETLGRNQTARLDYGADIAHELRTPLSILRGEIQALQDHVRPVTPKALDSLEMECNRLTALIEDLYQLALSDVGALIYQFEILDLNAVITDAIFVSTPKLKALGFELIVKLDQQLPSIRGDAQRLTQLCTNLLTNSQRYTDAPGVICVTTESITTEKGELRVLLHFDDSPPGVPSHLLPKLFDRLFRLESSRNRAAGGAGLGLSICKNIAQAHDGTLQASASPLGGLRVTLLLPVVS